MGFLDRWRKRKEKEQLEAVEEKGEVKVDTKAKKAEKAGKAKKAKVEKKVSEKREEKTAVKKVKKTKKGDAYKILIQPIISEKAAVVESNNVYTFMVEKNANKVEIKRAIRQIYGVEPKQVRVINMQGKRMRFGRNFGRRKDWKKAMVTLPKGHTINVHEGV